jgi:tRNA-specific adenosine deaminase 3
MFKNSNPYGPNPSDVKRSEGELHHGNSVHHWMRLAKRIAEEGSNHGLGEPIGAVIVERSEEHGVRVVAVAADARRCGMPHRDGEQDTNVMGHAVMRAIGLVGQKRRIVDDKPGARSPGTLSDHGSPPFSPLAMSPPREISPHRDVNTPRPVNPPEPVNSPQPDRSRRQEQQSSEETVATESSNQSNDTYSSSNTNQSTLLAPPETPTSFLDEPMTFLEAHYFAPNTLMPRGYLCLNLEVYTTHEPCVMCSMALLHSRFSRVVFAKEMPLTGGLVVKRKNPTEFSETLVGAKYGLFWRTELNWKFLCWQYGGGPEDDGEEEDDGDLAAQLAHMSLDSDRVFEVADVEIGMHA